MIRHVFTVFLLGSFTGALACGGDPEAGDGDTDALSCEHGKLSECACPDGAMGMQLCAHDTSGFEPCMCGGEDETASTTMPGTTAGTNATTTSNTTSEEESSTEPEDSSSGESVTTDPTTASETGPVGAPPTAMINHPGPEDREVGVPIPFVGVADDAEDGMLSGMAMVWTDDVEGEIGTGEMFDAALQTLGEHVVTLTVTDSDGNVTEDSIAFEIVAP